MPTPVQNPAPASQNPGNATPGFPWTSQSPTVLHAEADGKDLYIISASTRIFISDPSLQPLAKRLAEGFRGAAILNTSPPILSMSTGPLQPGDVQLKLATPDTTGVAIPVHGQHETYRIDISTTVEVTAQNLDAMARALTTLHKAARAFTTLESGIVIDAPAYAERSVLIDVGRKYYSPEWMKYLLREMAWNQLNTLHLHLTDNEGVRIIFPSAPDTASPDAWSRAELKDILDTAASYHIEVIPELETPGHMGWILKNRPQFQLKLSTGTVVPKALDFSIQAARDFLKDLLSDLIDMFPDSDLIHPGADEYFLSPISQSNTPQLAQYARAGSGIPNATSEDAVRYFVNDLAAFVQSKGKIARVWNDGAVNRTALIDLDKAVEIECWSLWGTVNGRNEMTAQELVDRGYTVKNSHGDFYFVILDLWNNLFHPLHSPYGLYNVYRANHFIAEAGREITVIDKDHPCLAGAGIQVWGDHPHKPTPEDVWDHLKEWLLPLGQRTWDSPNAAPDYQSLSLIARAVRYSSPESWYV